MSVTSWTPGACAGIQTRINSKTTEPTTTTTATRTTNNNTAISLSFFAGTSEAFKNLATVRTVELRMIVAVIMCYFCAGLVHPFFIHFHWLVPRQHFAFTRSFPITWVLRLSLWANVPGLSIHLYSSSGGRSSLARDVEFFI